MGDDSLTANKKSQKNISSRLLIISAILIGFLSGLGGALVLMRSLIESSKLEQDKQLEMVNQILLSKIEQLDNKVSEQKVEFIDIFEKIECLMEDDSLGFFQKLAEAQEQYNQREQELIQRLTWTEKELIRLNESIVDLDKSINQEKIKLEQTDKDHQEQIRLLKNSINELENKISELQRRQSVQ